MPTGLSRLLSDGRTLSVVFGVGRCTEVSTSRLAVARQRGSHVMLVKSGFEYTLSTPQHDELGPGLLRKLIRQPVSLWKYSTVYRLDRQGLCLA